MVKGENFRKLWGKYAGWAQTIMFIDDLKGFQKEKSDSLLLKSQSQSNILANVKKEPKEEPLIGEESTCTKKRPNTTSCQNLVKKKKKSL